MKRTKLLLVVAALALVICLPGMAGAVTSQALLENGTNPFDSSTHTFDTVMEVISGTHFSQPFNAMTAGWTATLSPDQLTVVATGPSAGVPLSTQFNWTEHYTVDTSAGPFTVSEYLFSGGLNGTFLWGATYDSNTGNIVGGPLSNPVPLPPSALLLGSGLLGLVGLGWRRRKTA